MGYLMKRSDMIEKIKVFMNNSYEDEIPWGAVDGEIILEMIEKAGMLPPTVELLSSQWLHSPQ